MKLTSDGTYVVLKAFEIRSMGRLGHQSLGERIMRVTTAPELTGHQL